MLVIMRKFRDNFIILIYCFKKIFVFFDRFIIVKECNYSNNCINSNDDDGFCNIFYRGKCYIIFNL